MAGLSSSGVQGVVAAAAAFVLVTGARAACFCDDAAIADEYGERDAVFVGKVVQRRRVDVPNYSDPKLPPVTPQVDNVLEVKRTFKGALASYVVVRAKRASPQYCGFEFEPDAEYIVWASNAGGALGYFVTWGCTRTRRTEEARDDLRWLDATGE